MNWQLTSYTLPLLLATAILGSLAYYTWKRRSTPGAGTFALLMAAAAWWALMYALELSGADLDTKVFWAKVKYLGVVTLPLTWFAFALGYTGREAWLSRRNLALLSIMPVVTLVLVATNEAHYLIWKPEMDVAGPFIVLRMGFGTWFWVHVAYSYTLLFLGTILLLRTIVPALRLYFPQNLALLLGVLTPWIFNALYIFRLSPVRDLDPTPFAFTVTGIALGWSLLRFRLLDLVPVARGAIVERVPAGIVVVDGQERVVDVNPAAQRILQCSASSAVGNPAREVLPNLADLLERHRVNGEAREEISFKNGSERRDYDLDLSSLRDERGNPSGRLIMLHDITGHKSTEERLQYSELKFRLVVESIGEALVITDLNDVVTFMNPRVTELTGYTEEDMLGRPAYELFLPQEEWPDIFRRNRNREQGISERYEMRLKRKDGESIWTEINASPYRNAAGEIVGTVGAIIDITERKRSEEKLREAEELFRTAFDRTPVGMALVSLEGQFFRVNDALCENLGYSKEEFLSMTFAEITYHEDYEKTMAHVQRIWDGEVESYSLEKRYVHAEGHPVWVALSVSLVRDSEGNPLHHIIQVQDMSERKSIEETLRESEQRFRQLFDQSVDSMLIHDESGNLVDCNPEACRVHGYTREELLSLSIKDLTDNLLSEEERLARQRAGGTLWQRAIAGELGTTDNLHQGEHKRKDGSTFPVEVLLGSVSYAGSGLVLASVRDIPERKRVEDALRESEERFRTLVQYGRDIISVLEIDGTIRYESPAVERVLGYQPQEMVRTSAFDYVHPDDLDRVVDAFLDGVASNLSTAAVECRFRHKDGSWRHLDAIGVNLLEDPAVQGIIVNSRDITDRKKAEQELHDSEYRYRSVVESEKEVIFQTDAAGQWVFLNPAWTEITDFSIAESLGQNLLDYVHSEDRQQNAQEFQPLVRGEIDYCRYETRYVTRDGSYRWIEVYAQPNLDSAGNISGTSGTLNDVTMRKQFEYELRESEERYRSLVELSPDAIAVHSDGELVYINLAGAQMFGADRPEELIGRKALDFVHPDYRELAVERINAALEGEPAPLVEEQYFRLDGSVINVEVAGMPVEYLGKRAVQVVLRDVTERNRIQAALSESERRLRAIVEGSGVGISIAGPDRTLLETNPAYQEMTGYSVEELRGKPIAELSHPSEVPSDAVLNEKLLSGELDRYQVEKRYLRKDGEVIWVKPTVSVVRNAEGEPLFLVGVVEDITERRRTANALRESEERFRQLFEQSVDLLFVHDDTGRIFECKAEACRALGYSRDELLDLAVGDIADNLLTAEDRSLQEDETLWEHAMRSEPGQIVGFEQNNLLRKDGTKFSVEVGVGAIDYGGRRLIFASARDITERKVLEEQLTYQAFHDSLTFLPNRDLFLERMEHALARLSRRQCYIAVLFMDLDNFKVVNDSLGHEVGDRLLRAVSERLRTCIRPEDTIARFGGDEFTMLLEDVTHVDEAKRVAERITEVLQPPIELEQQEVFANITIGIALGTSSEDEAEDLLRKADMAMYEAKKNGKAQYVVFEAGMATRMQDRLELEGDLRRAIENEEFVVYYQPEISLDTGEVSGFEALVRWEHPSRGIVSPKQFIALAEESGLILPIERMVLEDACNQLSRWRERFSSSLVVSVNLYQRQLQQPDLVQPIARRLQEA
ncbi:hypothetical protein BH23ACT11_BH23ACT11_15930 [soil metagenome]